MADWNAYRQAIGGGNLGVDESGQPIPDRRAASDNPQAREWLLNNNMIFSQDPNGAYDPQFQKVLNEFSKNTGQAPTIQNFQRYQYGEGQFLAPNSADNPTDQWLYKTNNTPLTPKGSGIADTENAQGWTGAVNKVLGNPLTYAGIAAGGAAGLFGDAGGAGAGFSGGGGTGAFDALGGGIAGTDLGGASLASQGLTTATGTGAGSFATGEGVLGSVGLDAAGAVGGAVGTMNPATGVPYGAEAGGAPLDLNGNPIGNVDEFGNPISSDTLGTTPGSTATRQAAQSALSRIINGQGTADDYMKLAGQLGSVGVGIAGADASRSALNGVADKYLALGAPSRARLEASYAPGFSMMNEPGYKDAIDSTMDAYLRKASTGGNPFSNPGVSAEALKYVNGNLALPQLNTFRSQNASQGGLGVNVAGTASTNAASGAATPYNALQYGIGAVTNPPSNLDDLLSKLGINAAKLGTGAYTI